MANVLITMNEDPRATSADRFGVTYKVDEHDCLQYAAALEALGHCVYFVNWQDFGGRQFARMFCDNQNRFVTPLPLESMDLVWVYQMEGFYRELSRFLDMIAAFEEACALVINDPRTIRHNLGKHYLWALSDKVAVIETHRVDDRVVRRLTSGERFVLKPLFGERGEGVFLANAPEHLSRIASREEQYIAQAYMPGVREGERSFVFVGLEYHHAVLKRPCPHRADEFRCNESLGGTVEAYEPTQEELAYAVGVLQAYASLDCPVHYSRIDFVHSSRGPVLMEAELLNPAAFANYSGNGVSFGRRIATYLDGLMRVANARGSTLNAVS